MALLAQPKRKDKYGFDPRNTNWASDDSKFGQKLMEKMGWEKGKGLGANEDGIVEHIKASYKQDTRGLGSTPKDADAWIAHQDDFNDLLKKLNGEAVESETSEKSNDDGQAGRKRFLGRFARGRVQTLRTTDDLDCILGRRKASESSTPINHSATNSDDEEKESSLKTVTSSCSVQEYFTKKMNEIKSRNSKNDQSETNNGKGFQPLNKLDSEENKKQPTTVPVYGAVSFSYGDDEAPINNEVIERGWYIDQEWKENGSQKKSKKKKKKSKKTDTVEETENIMEESFQHEVPKKKKKKDKSEISNQNAISADGENIKMEPSEKSTDDNASVSGLAKKVKKKRKLNEDEKGENSRSETCVQDGSKQTETEIKKRKSNNEDNEEECSLGKKKKKKKKRKLEEEQETDISAETKEKIKKAKTKSKTATADNPTEYIINNDMETTDSKMETNKVVDDDDEEARNKEKKERGKGRKVQKFHDEDKVGSEETTGICDSHKNESNLTAEDRNFDESSQKCSSCTETGNKKKGKKKSKDGSKSESRGSSQEIADNCNKQERENESIKTDKNLKIDEPSQIDCFSNEKKKMKKEKKKSKSVEMNDSSEKTNDAESRIESEEIDNCDMQQNDTNITKEDDKSLRVGEPSQNDSSCNKKEKKKKKKDQRIKKVQVDDSTEKTDDIVNKTENIETVEASGEGEKKKSEKPDSITKITDQQKCANTSLPAPNILKIKRQEKKKKRKTKKDLNDSFPGSNFGELNGYEPLDFSKSS